MRPLEGIFCTQLDLWGSGLRGCHRDPCRPLSEAGEGFLLYSRFFIPGRHLSRPSLKRFAQIFNRSGNIKASIDDLIAKIPLEDFTVSLSSAYEWIYQSVRALRLNAGQLAVTVGAATSVLSLSNASPSAIDDLFQPEFIWHPSHHMLLYPP
jgi:hypothetical protein